MKEVFVCLLLACSLSSSGQFWRYDTSYSLNVNVERKELIYKPNNCFAALNHAEGRLYFKLTSQMAHRQDLYTDGIGMKFYVFDMQLQQADSAYVKIPDKYLNEMGVRDVLRAFVANRQYAVVKLVNNTLLLFEKTNTTGRTFTFKKEISNDYCFDGDFYPLSNGRFLWVNYFDYHPLDCKYKTVLAVFDPQKAVLEKTLVVDKVEGIEWSKSVHKWVDVSLNKIVLCEPRSGLFKVFDHRLEQLDSFYLDSIRKTVATNEASNGMAAEGYIEKCYWVNDTNLLVSFNDQAESANRDVYRISLPDKKVVCRFEKLNISMPRSVNTTLPNRDNFWHNIFWQNIPEFFFYQNKVISLTTVHFPEYWKEPEMTNQRYRELLSTYSDRQTPQYGIRMFSLLCH